MLRIMFKSSVAVAAASLVVGSIAQPNETHLVCKGEVKEDMLFKPPGRLEKRVYQVVVDATLRPNEGLMVMRGGYWGCMLPMGDGTKENCFGLRAKFTENEILVQAQGEDANLRAMSSFTLSRISGQLRGINEAFVREGSDYKWSSSIGTVNLQCAAASRQF